MTKRETILTLILFIAVSWLGFSQQEQNYERELAVLQNRISILEEIIKNYEVIEVLNDEIEVVRVKRASIDEVDLEWIKWIAENQWILGIEWGE